MTPNKNAAAVKQVVLETLGDDLELELPSDFAGAGRAFEAALDEQVVAVKSDTQTFGDIAPSARVLSAHLEGVAVVLDNIDPPLRPSEIRQRFERARMQPTAGHRPQPYRDFDVVTAGDEESDEPVRRAVLLISDPFFPHDKDPAKWAQELAAPVWRLVNDGISGDATLQRVVNFDAQVAAETQREAGIAMILSIVGIMAYIWLRFGNLKYGTATVIALVHDTLATIAVVGFAHYLAPTFIGSALLIEPFRVNLTLVAALLTVMGYSLNDKVVVFDRIRENRGKFGAISRRVINDSINQTLSRTLLTGGTTILTIFVMYVFGGPGIHGFTYCLLLGILIGTYSSITIAAPILLFGGETVAEEARKPQPVGQLQRA